VSGLSLLFVRTLHCAPVRKVCEVKRSSKSIELFSRSPKGNVEEPALILFQFGRRVQPIKKAGGQAEDVPAGRAQLARPLARHGTGGRFDSVQAWCDVKHARSIEVCLPRDKREIGEARHSFFSWAAMDVHSAG
jgi:hypothetical protein